MVSAPPRGVCASWQGHWYADSPDAPGAASAHARPPPPVYKPDDRAPMRPGRLRGEFRLSAMWRWALSRPPVLISYRARSTSGVFGDLPRLRPPRGVEATRTSAPMILHFRMLPRTCARYLEIVHARAPRMVSRARS